VRHFFPARLILVKHHPGSNFLVYNFQPPDGREFACRQSFFLPSFYVCVASMTTFTKLGDQDTPVISVHPSRRISKINPNIYAGFTE
jgi:hypothetical protein